MTNVKESYQDLVDTLRHLGVALIPATAARYEAPPRTYTTRESTADSHGVRNPTLDIVIDPRRMALSEEIRATATALLHARAVLHPHIKALQLAVERWEGTEGAGAL